MFSKESCKTVSKAMEDGSTEEAFNVAMSTAKRIICLARFGGL